MSTIASLVIVTLVVAVGPTAVSTVERQEPDSAMVNAAEVETRAQEIFRNVMSPYCPGRLLSNCPSRQAAVLQDSIRTALREGASPEEIEDRLLAAYGEEVRPAPAFSGLGIWAWIVPGLFFVGGGALAARWVGRRTRQREPTGQSGAPKDVSVDDGDNGGLDERLERELADISDR